MENGHASKKAQPGHLEAKNGSVPEGTIGVYKPVNKGTIP